MTKSYVVGFMAAVRTAIFSDREMLSPATMRATACRSGLVISAPQMTDSSRPGKP